LKNFVGRVNDIMNKTRKMVLTALFTAFVCVATLLIRIPTPGTGGYANLGDAMVLYSAYILGPVWGAFAAGVGSALADIILGYISYAPATLIIKALVALAAFGLMKVFCKKYFIAGLIAEVIMVFGYFFFEAVILGLGIPAAASIPANIGQAVVGIILSSLVMTIKPLKNIQ